MILSVRQYLLAGFGIVLALFIATSAYIIIENKKIRKIEERLLENRLPTVLAGEKLLDGIDLSLAGLRGYMILGNEPKKAEKFKAERAKGWAKIDATLAQYQELSSTWSNSENLERLDTINTLLEEFRQAQQEVEDISHTPENIASINLLLTKASPVAQKVSQAITVMINEEAELEATPERKALLKLMADSRGSFALGLASIRAYLLSNDANFRKDFDAKWRINEQRYQQLSQKTGLFAGAQKKAWQDYKTYRSQFAPLPPVMFTLRQQDDWNKANYWLGTKAAPKAGKIKKLLAELAASQDELTAIDTAALTSEQNTLSTLSVITCLISIIVGMIIAVFLSQSMDAQVKAMVYQAKEIAKGNLTTPDLEKGMIKDFNVLSTAMNTTRANLNTLISDISVSSDGLSNHTQQLEALITDSQNAVNQQQQETDLIATAMNEMGATVKEVASNTTEAANSAEGADKSATQGHQVVIETVDSINELAKAIENAAEAINQLGEETNAVDTILASISGIADQTNLLALNAAIEAARAGEQGRGFAVVADEVRTLAARTQESTIEIRAMLDKLKVGANNAVEVMGVGHKQAQGSVEKAHIAKETLEAITATVNTIRDMNIQIATAAEEQSAVTDEMSRNITAINTGAQQVVSYSQQSTESSHEMSTLANTLAKSVAKFRV